mmetsp:Transcript_754/g.836  ORF Transcript_754/g.836 Transcript_754/m.836 type:complete len:228 (-) Transcript_754:239-922(-)
MVHRHIRAFVSSGEVARYFKRKDFHRHAISLSSSWKNLSTLTDPNIENGDILDTTKSETPRRNLGLASVKEQGLQVLIGTASDIESKTKRRLLVEDEQTGPSVTQIREANRLREIVDDAIEQYTSKKGAMFCVQGEPIAIIDAEISPDLKQARVFWSLPYGFLLTDRLSSRMREQTIARMQHILEERGGVLQGIVHNKMRSYNRPPRIRFVPAEGELLRNVLKDLIS